MSTSDLETFFLERLEEVTTYLTFLEDLEASARLGPPRFSGTTVHITAAQQKILYSSLYLQLYNLVEATVSRCIDAITDAATDGNQWRPSDLNVKLQSEWVRSTARTHVDLTPDHRLEAAVLLCNKLVDQLPIDAFAVQAGGGGNWDSKAIRAISARLGCRLNISRKTTTASRKPIRDDLGALELVKNRRNRLAHGGLSFVECADGVSVAELRTLVDAVSSYLSEAIASFVSYIESHEFLRPERQPANVT